MREQAAKHWLWVAETRKAERQQREQQYRSMPDVAHPPDRTVPTAFDGVTCAHGHREFYVERWVVLNGARSRMQARCAEDECPFFGTYDFLVKDWVWQAS